MIILHLLENLTGGGALRAMSFRLYIIHSHAGRVIVDPQGVINRSIGYLVYSDLGPLYNVKVYIGSL